jgi:hypothetical protein
MATIQLSLLKISLFVFGITMIFIGYTMYKAVYTAKWDPIVGNCPDYWADVNGDGSKCVNTHGLGTCNLPTQLFTLFSGKNSIGNDLTRFSNLSLQNCKAACLNDAKCAGVAFQDSTNTCVLKTADVKTAEQQNDARFDLWIENEKGLANSMNFNQAPFSGSNGSCSKYNWATSCKVTWDGITSGISNPCTSTNK